MIFGTAVGGGTCIHGPCIFVATVSVCVGCCSRFRDGGGGCGGGGGGGEESGGNCGTGGSAGSGKRSLLTRTATQRNIRTKHVFKTWCFRSTLALDGSVGCGIVAFR